MFDQDKYDSIVNKYKDNLTKYCFTKLPYDYFAAEEIADDVFIIMYEKWDTLRFTGVKTWLIRTANNCILHYLRDKKYEASLDDFSDNSLPDDLLIKNQEDKILDKEYINTLLNSLNEDEKILFKYRYLDDMTLSDISSKTKIPYSTIRLRLTNIDKKIKSFIKTAMV